MTALTYQQRALSAVVHCADCGIPFRLGWIRDCDRRPRCEECYKKYGAGDTMPFMAEEAAQLATRLRACEKASSVACERLGGALADVYATGDALMLSELKSWCMDRGLPDVAAMIDNLMEVEAHWLNASRDYANAAAKGRKGTNRMKVKAIKKNVTEIVSNDGHTMVLVSYETPVAFHRSGELPYVTEKKHSTTTSRHINEWLTRHDFEKYEKVSQESVDLMADNFGANVNPPEFDSTQRDFSELSVDDPKTWAVVRRIFDTADEGTRNTDTGGRPILKRREATQLIKLAGHDARVPPPGRELVLLKDRREEISIMNNAGELILTHYRSAASYA